MKTPFIGILILFSSAVLMSGQEVAPTDTIRAVFCDIDQHDYPSATHKLQSLLDSDQRNPAMRKLLVAVQMRMIKENDKTPENLAVIRKTIEGYKGLLRDLQLKLEEKKQFDSSILELYRQLGEEELKQELLKRGADSKRTIGERAEAFAVLAANAWECSFGITSRQGAKDAIEIAKAKACVTEGLRFSNQALKLDPKSDTAWSNETNLLLEASKIAGLEGRASEKTAYLKLYERSLRKRTTEVSASSEDHFTLTEMIKNRDLAIEAEDLLEFKAENSLEKVVNDLLPFPVEPKLLPDPKHLRIESDASNSSLAQQKRDWKTLTVAEDLTLDLPDNSRRTATGYDAGSNGVFYSINATDRTSLEARFALGDRILNAIARHYVGFTSSAWIEGGYGNIFELKFLRKEMSNGRPRNIYSYSLRSCGESKEGVLLIQASQSHFYLIDISGATYSHASVQRVLSSIKVK